MSAVFSSRQTADESAAQVDWVSPDEPPVPRLWIQQSQLHIGADGAVARIQDEYRHRVSEVRQACQLAVFKERPQEVIDKIVDLVSLDECMVHAMSRAMCQDKEVFDAQRLLRRCDIDLLLSSAEQLGDMHMKLLGETLLENHKRYVAKTLDAIGQTPLPGF